MESLNIGEMDKNDLNAIHSIVLYGESREWILHEDYTTSIKRLVQTGCELDENNGKGTALSMAIEIGNYEAVIALLSCGADINEVSEKIKSQIIQQFFDRPINLFIAKTLVHLWKLMYFIPVKFFKDDYIRELLQEHYPYFFNVSKRNFCTELDNLEKVHITHYYTLKNFLDETIDLKELNISNAPEEEIDEYFRRDNRIDETFPELSGILLAKYRLFKKTRLRKSAIEALLLLIPIPHLCADIVVKYLTFNTLCNLVTLVQSGDVQEL